jgi:hypothetical protein
LKKNLYGESFVNYEKWNDILCDHFFGTKNKNKIIYLYVNEDLVKKLATKLDINRDEALSSFCKSVRTYVRNDPDSLFEKVYIRGRKWFNQGKIGNPPFIGVLALTVLAATKMKQNRERGIGAGNYYLRLRNLIELNGQGKPLGFERTKLLWNYLISWQNENEGEYGYTNVFRYGQVHIGYPMSQCIVKDADREHLYEFFYWAGLHPQLTVNPDTMLEQLELFLSTKASRLSRLFFSKNKGIREAIIQAVLFEFKNWDRINNSFNRDNNTLESREKNNVKKYNLFLRIDKNKDGNYFNPNFKISFFSIVDDDVVIDENIDIKELKGFHYKNNAFYREVDLTEGNIISTKHTFSLLNNQLELILNGENIISFQRGTDLGIDGWVNSDNIILGKDHLILFREEKEKKVIKWTELNEFPSNEISFPNLSSSWKCRLVKVFGQTILNLEELGEQFVFTQAQDKITFHEGLKVGNMEWLLSAPPIVSISSLPKTTLFVNDVAVLSLITGEDNIDLRGLYFKESMIYRIRFSNTEKTILLKNNHENLISFSEFKPKEYSDGKIKIAGTYIYDSLETHPRPYKQNGSKAFLSTESTYITKYIPNYINAMPFNCNRTFKDIGVSLSDDQLTIERPIDLFFEYLTIRKEGNWDAFIKGIKWCFGLENINLIAYKVRQKLSQLGFVEFIRDRDTNKFYWNVIPISIAVIPSHDPIVYLTGGRTRESIRQLERLTEGRIKLLWSKPKSPYEPISLYLLSKTVKSLKVFLYSLNIKFNWGLDYFSYDLLRCLPVLSSYIKNAPEFHEPRSTNNTYWKVKGWDIFSGKWIENNDSSLKMYLDSFGQYICLYKTPTNKIIKLNREVGKLYYAQQKGLRIFQYKNYKLKVKLGYELPELYERVLTSCVGQCPQEENGYRTYRNVTHEIAISLAYKLGFELVFNS